MEADGTRAGLEIRGQLDTIQYFRPSAQPFDPGATATIVMRTEGDVPDIPILTAVSLNADDVWRPCVAHHDVTGAETGDVSFRHVFCDSRVHVSVTGGGAGNTGNFRLVFD